ncbi:MAG: peptidoglycan-binding protein [Patescibacteria group bacterium]
MNLKKAVFLVGMFSFVFSAISFAQTIIPTQISLDSQANTNIAVGKCIILSRSLKRGSSGEDVKKLQEFLASNPTLYPEKIISGYFGALTEKAVQRWQVRNGIVTSGDPATTGYGVVGPKTIKYFNSNFSCQSKQSATTVIPKNITLPSASVIIKGNCVLTTTTTYALPNKMSSILPKISRDTRGFKTIPFKISAEIWDAENRVNISTPVAIVEKVKKAFELWSSVDEAKIQFEFAGLEHRQYENASDIPSDGTIYIIFNTSAFKGVFDQYGGFATYFGSIPNNYEGGYAFVSMKNGVSNLNIRILIHEIGHTLGILDHRASISSPMACATPMWNDFEYLAFSEQDRVQLISAWSPSHSSVYKISGTIQSSIKDKSIAVFAVDTANGHTYSSLVSADNKFSIAIGRSGSYRVFAKQNESGLFEKTNLPDACCPPLLPSFSPSWYVSNTESSNDPYAGKVLVFGNSARSVEDIHITMIEKSPSFSLFEGYFINNDLDPNIFMPSFARPGTSGQVLLQHVKNDIVSVREYGSNPDYALSNLNKSQYKNVGASVYSFDVAIKPGAVPGDRLIIAQGKDNVVQAGLIGLHVIGSAIPSVIPPSCGWRTEADWIRSQFAGDFNFETLDTDYWKR